MPKQFLVWQALKHKCTITLDWHDNLKAHSGKLHLNQVAAVEGCGVEN